MRTWNEFLEAQRYVAGSPAEGRLHIDHETFEKMLSDLDQIASYKSKKIAIGGPAWMPTPEKHAAEALKVANSLAKTAVSAPNDQTKEPNYSIGNKSYDNIISTINDIREKLKRGDLMAGAGLALNIKAAMVQNRNYWLAALAKSMTPRPY